ncbi:hypothetical protein [Pollutimonas sp. M17]|uniref:hypothetical protein n=1 Tax=Pollutimonas sp. M17 TaxID=2962065 RepID=UPI0021F42B3E|nr:hypothetical protein [Pollutimonas sp. M17]UYO93944.1 hypothetical protein OEG81_01030 [Pollutimonas sp. M17]
MKLEKAYSEELNKNITAEEADYRYSIGDITSKYAFSCPDDSCTAPVTCANLDKPKAKRKRDPYYKIVGEHHPDCLIKKDINLSDKRPATSDSLYSGHDEYIDGAVRLNLNPPSAKRFGGEAIRLDKERMALVGLRQYVVEEGKRRIRPSKTLSSMIDAFLNHEDIAVQLPRAGTLPIKDLFVELDAQEISNFEDEYRIYYGKAWINKNDKGYVIRFVNTLKYGELETRPTFFVPQDMIEQTSYTKFRSSVLDKLTDKLPKNLFILSETGPYFKDRYINFWLEGLEYMDYRDLQPRPSKRHQSVRLQS